MMAGLYRLYFICLVIISSSVLGNQSSEYHAGSCGGRFEISNESTFLQLGTVVYTNAYNDSDGNEVEYSIESYKTYENCTFHVFSTNAQPMIVTSEYFSVEYEEDCLNDYMGIEDDRLETKYCGMEPLAYITSSLNKLTVTFHSDRSLEYLGFKIAIQSQKVDENSFCNNTILGDKYASDAISNSVLGTSCFYKIQAENEKNVQLTLQQIDFGSRTCEEESVIVYEGHSTHGKKLKVICSDTMPQVLPFRAHAFFIEYRNPLNNEQEDAFKIKYEFVESTFSTTTPIPTTKSPVGGDNDCSRRYTDLQDELLTYTSPYEEDNKHCIVVVRNTMLVNHLVQVKFEYFDMEESVNCTFDSLRIFSGERDDSPTLGGPYCGDSLNGRIFVSSGNSLRLEFKTDRSYAASGFKALITFEPYDVCSCDGEQICVQQGYEKKCISGQNCDRLCQNDGTCVKKANTEMCYCKDGFKGEDCSISEDGSEKRHLRFLKAPLNKYLREGSANYPDCQLDIDADTQVTYQWTFNGEYVGEYNKKTGFGDRRGEIDSFTEKFEGQYACIATTSFGVAEHTFQLRLASDCKANIDKGPGSNTKNVGQSILLTCYIERQGAVKEVTWKKNGLAIDLNGEKFKIKSNYYLQISNIELSDKGTYTCHLVDENNCPSSKSGKLTVLDYRPLNKICGISTWDEDGIRRSRISNGDDARPNENPWHVVFRSKGSRTFCGGTLISKTFVLTAGHCVKDFKGDFKTVSMFFGTTECTGAGQNRRVESFTLHPDYDKRAKYDNDIAIIELDTPIEYGNSIRPICLRQEGYVDEVLLEGYAGATPRMGRVVGCGQSGKGSPLHTNLKVVHVPYVPREKCEESLTKNGNFTDSMFCAGSVVENTGDACQGDSGGGMIMSPDDQWVLAGIVSSGIGCDKNDHYGFYTNFGKFYDWIREETKFDEEIVENFIDG